MLKHCSYHLYADDFIIYLSCKLAGIADAISKVNEDLSNIAQWATRNGLIINPRKTQAIWIGSRGFIRQLDESNLPTIFLDGTPIVPGNSLKILGVTIDSTLSWRDHSNNLAKKYYSSLARLKTCHLYLTQETKLLLVKSLIFPHLEYCVGAFMDISDEVTKKLGRCKNAALRIVTNRKIFEHITPAYPELEILSFDRCKFLTISLLAKILRGMMAPPISVML